MLQKLTVSAVFFSAIIFSGCNSDKGTGGGGNVDIVGNWMITAATINPGVDMGAGIVTDFFDFAFEVCSQDDLYTYNANGTFSSSEGATSCVPPTTPESGTWTLTGNTLVETRTGSTTPDTTVFATLTATTGTVQETIPGTDFPDGISRTLTITATKQ